jgi:hypothetical protein
VTEAAETTRPALAWWKLVLILVPSLAVGYYAAFFLALTTFGIPVFILLIGGPLYAAIVLPIIAVKWRRGRSAPPLAVDEAMLRFGTNAQRWHFALMGTLLVNLALALLALFTSEPGTIPDAAGWVAIAFGPIAMVCAIPAIILGVRWALNETFPENEGAALTQRVESGGSS